jgi:hypothetical protein
MQVRDYYGELRGFVHRSETLKPKTLTEVQQGYCRLHFPVLAQGRTKIVLVEDIPSAELLSCYVPAVALNGSSLSDAQVQYLVSVHVTKVVFCLDDDATSKAIQQARKHRALLDSCAVYCSPDPKDMTHDQLLSLSNRIHEVL